MGIDVYLRWDGMTKEDEARQITGFDTGMGHVGYLREAYHGTPYATKVLLPESFEPSFHETVHIRSSTLRSRLPKVIETVIEREAMVYHKKVTEKDSVVRSFVRFVELHERLEREGKNPRIEVSA